MSRQARQFRLPVDKEETSLAFWRVNTPPVRSGEPETEDWLLIYRRNPPRQAGCGEVFDGAYVRDAIPTRRPVTGRQTGSYPC